MNCHFFFFSKTRSDEVSTSLIDLLFSHVVSDHWTGQNKSTPSDTSVQEVRVSVQEVGVLPSTSATPPELDSYEELDEATKPHGYSQSDCQVVIVPDGALNDPQATPLR